MTPFYFGRGEDPSCLLAGASKVGDEIVIGADPLAQCRELAFYVVFSEDAVGGAVEIASGPSRGFAGQWSELTTVRWVGSGRAHYVSVDGMHLAIKIRVSEPLGMGTVSVFGVGG